MKSSLFPIPINEDQRLISLKEYGILDTLPDKQLDNLVNLASVICNSPIALITLIDENRQWFKAKTGIELNQTERKNSFCQFTIMSDEIFEVTNALEIEEFRNNCMVAGETGIRFYAGAPLINSEGYRLGSLCVIDYVPKKLTKEQRQTLKTLSDLAVNCFELKKSRNELFLAKEKAEKANRVKSQFLSVMTHEIRTPLNAIIGTSHLLLQKNPLPHQVQYLNALHYSSQNLLSLANDILDFNKIESGNIDLEYKEFDLKVFLKNVKNMFMQKAEEKGLLLNLRLDEELPTFVIGDKLRLSQILHNLVGNAIKFTEKGAVIIDILVSSKKSDSCSIEIAVSDTGIGINETELTRIFTAFNQATEQTWRKYGGSGLGLTISKNLVELMGGTLQVKSEEGTGSRFSFILSFKIGSIIPSDSSFDSFNQVKVSFKGKRILLVEDNEMNILVALQFINDLEITADIARSGEEAVALAQKNQYDLILMDLQMPFMDGYEASQQIRGSGNNEVPIIAQTASCLSEIKEEVANSGMNGVLLKPYSPDDLYIILEKFLVVEGKS